MFNHRSWKRLRLGLCSGYLLLILSGVLGCVSDPPAKDAFSGCRYAAPEPVFNAAVAGVSRHSFTRQKAAATESFLLNQFTEVEIQQSGCDHIRQVFIFRWPAPQGGAGEIDWPAFASVHFEGLGQLGAPYLSYLAMSEAISERSENLKAPGSTVALQPGLQFKLSGKRKGSQLELTAEVWEAP